MAATRPEYASAASPWVAGAEHSPCAHASAEKSFFPSPTTTAAGTHQSQPYHVAGLCADKGDAGPTPYRAGPPRCDGVASIEIRAPRFVSLIESREAVLTQPRHDRGELESPAGEWEEAGDEGIKRRFCKGVQYREGKASKAGCLYVPRSVESTFRREISRRFVTGFRLNGRDGPPIGNRPAGPPIGRNESAASGPNIWT
eukprot:1195121-Prorocentrum_minimum.AAC.3